MQACGYRDQYYRVDVFSVDLSLRLFNGVGALAHFQMCLVNGLQALVRLRFGVRCLDIGIYTALLHRCIMCTVTVRVFCLCSLLSQHFVLAA